MIRQAAVETYSTCWILGGGVVSQDIGAFEVVEEAILGELRCADTSDSRARGRLSTAMDRVRKAKVLEQREGCNMQGGLVKMRRLAGPRNRELVQPGSSRKMTKDTRLPKKRRLQSMKDLLYIQKHGSTTPLSIAHRGYQSWTFGAERQALLKPRCL